MLGRDLLTLREHFCLLLINLLLLDDRRGRLRERCGLGVRGLPLLVGLAGASNSSLINDGSVGRGVLNGSILHHVHLLGVLRINLILNQLSLFLLLLGKFESMEASLKISHDQLHFGRLLLLELFLLLRDA